MSNPSEHAARKQLLLARSTLYRLRLQQDATRLRSSMATPARGLALLKYLPIALMALRLFKRGRGGSVMPALLSLASVAANALLGGRAR